MEMIIMLYQLFTLNTSKEQKIKKKLLFYQANTWNRSEMANFFLPIVFISAPC